jgi:hypothetical protein
VGPWTHIRVIAGKGGRYHVDSLFSGYGVLKVGEVYRQQLRLHAWKFCNGRPDGNSQEGGWVT